MAWLWAQTIGADTAWLSEAEVRHVERVLRRRPGAAVAVIDGAGRRARGTWAGGARVDVEQVETWPPRRLTLILGLGARETNEDGLRRAAELGASQILPVWTECSAAAGATKQRFDMERWRRIVASGCAQAGNPWLPEVAEPASWSEVCAQVGAANILAVDPRATEPLQPGDRVVALAVGPEGGFSEAELSSVRTASLGPYVLRTPVAVAVALGVLATRWEPACAA